MSTVRSRLTVGEIARYRAEGFVQPISVIESDVAAGLRHAAAEHIAGLVPTERYELTDNVKVGRIEIGTGVTVGTAAIILYDSVIGDFAQLGPLTVVMKGEFIPPHTIWSGAPARRGSAQDAALGLMHPDAKNGTGTMNQSVA